jgi:hypothetical protein
MRHFQIFPFTREYSLLDLILRSALARVSKDDSPIAAAGPFILRDAA